MRAGYYSISSREKHLVQIEPTMDASSWAERERRYTKKFRAGKKYIPTLFKGLDIPDNVEQIALLVFGSKKNRTTLAGGKILLANELIEDILTNLKGKSIFSEMVAEQFPILRTLQFVSEYKDNLYKNLFHK